MNSEERNGGTHRYDIPMVGVKQWYKDKMEAVGHLAAMEDAYLRRMYASKVVNGMNHLVKALDEKVANNGYEHKKRDLQLMKESTIRVMEHLKKEYDVTENNISYKWNTAATATPPSSIRNVNDNDNVNANNTLNEDKLTLEELRNFTGARSDEPNARNTNARNTNGLNGVTPNILSGLTLNATLPRNTLNANANANANAPVNANANALQNANARLSNLNRKILNSSTSRLNKNSNKSKAKPNTLIGGARRKDRKRRSTRRATRKN
jgi:hypothetical protein